MFGRKKKQPEPEPELQPDFSMRVLELHVNMTREEMAQTIAEFEGKPVKEINPDDWLWVPFWRRRR